MSLAQAVREICGANTKITYAADWTEYGSHVLEDGAEVRFPLDPLWACSDIDAVGVDFYPPLADWRKGHAHIDAAAFSSIYDVDYLRANVTGGEYADWYYRNAAERDAQIRTPITDGLGKPWVFAAKRLKEWWSHPHFERTAGFEHETPTAWQPGSKPIWLTETGCPAVDKGANAPNLFPDAKSSASGLPPYSSGERDDRMQRSALEALLSVYGPNSAENPVSSFYGSTMVDPAHTALWTWDARPYPAFPALTDVWADGPAHETGHWLTGRLGQAGLAELAAEILRDGGVDAFDTSSVEGLIHGYAVDRPASVREKIEPLAELYGFSAHERDGTIVFRARGQEKPGVLQQDDLAEDGKSAAPHFVRAQETELPREIAIGFADPDFAFQPRVARALRHTGSATALEVRDTAVTSAPAEMQRRADILLQDIWIGRDVASFALAPDRLAYEPGDLVTLDGGDETQLFEITEIVDGAVRRMTARAIAPEMFEAPRPVSTPPRQPEVLADGPAEIVVLDVGVEHDNAPVLAWVAATATPWPGSVVLWKEVGGTYSAQERVSSPAVIGETLSVLGAGKLWCFDRHNQVTVTVSGRVLSSASDERLFAGANACAIRGEDGEWEVLQFGRADLVGLSTYRLSHFLRGQNGTEVQAARDKPSGSLFVLLDETLVPVARDIDELGRMSRWRAAPAMRDYADPVAVSFEVTPGKRALLPFAPVHVRASRKDEAILIEWIRRTRSGGDSWEVAEVPLSETREAYRVDILRDGKIVRTIEVLQPQLIYENELTDFGVRQDRLVVRISQISSIAGPGQPTEVMLNV